MQGHRGLGSNPLRVSLAIPRNYNMIPGTSSGGSSSTTSGLTASIASTIVHAAAAQSQGQSSAGAVAAGLGQYLDPSYWQQQQQQYGWQGYGYQGYDYSQTGAYPAGQQAQWPATAQPEEDEFEPVEHSTVVDIEKMNRELFESNQDLWDTLDECRWTQFNADKIATQVKNEEATAAS